MSAPKIPSLSYIPSTNDKVNQNALQSLFAQIGQQVNAALSALFSSMKIGANFDGTGTGAIKPRWMSGLRSITRNSTGIYTVTHALNVASYAVVGNACNSATGGSVRHFSAFNLLPTSFQIATRSADNSAVEDEPLIQFFVLVP